MSMSTAAEPLAPEVGPAAVTFRLADPHLRLRGVRLYQEVRVPGDRLDFRYRRGNWTLRLPRPDVDRMEYLFELHHPNDSRETVTDPGNPRRVAGAFGDKSVIEFPGYRAPWWLDQPAVESRTDAIEVPSRHLGAAVHGAVWTPVGLSPDVPAPLLIVNDGAEYAWLAAFTHYVGVQVGRGALPPVRVALLEPGDRNRWYAAYPAFARALAEDVVPALDSLGPATVRIGVGASLGALALLHAHRLFPEVFGGLFLQSGSFFRPAFDAQERRFARFGPVTRFVADVDQAVADPHPVPVVLTCGRLEENLANNEAMAATLAALGYPVRLRTVPDVHNYTAWRDALDPDLTDLVSGVLTGGWSR